jgi:phage terminase small subunit
MPALKNKKHERFCREYVIDHNGTQAAIRTGYSKKTAKEQASKLLTKININERIKELDGDIFDKLGCTHEKVAQAYIDLAFTTCGDLFEYVDERIEDADGNSKVVRKAYLKANDQLTKQQLATIQEISETTAGIRIKQYSRKDALDMIAKLKGMLVEKKEVTGSEGGPIETIVHVIVDPKSTKNEKVNSK